MEESKGKIAIAISIFQCLRSVWYNRNGDCVRWIVSLSVNLSSKQNVQQSHNDWFLTVHSAVGKGE